MAKKSSHLVCQHMERIPARALEQYEDIIREYIRGRHGVYALYKRDRLYYVGLASNLKSRLGHHLADRHKGLWDRFNVYLTNESAHIKELESMVLRITKPKGNSVNGKFPKSEDLKRQLKAEVKKRQQQELADLMGKKAAIAKRHS
jgi:GIY-YIG catalytic domain